MSIGEVDVEEQAKTDRAVEGASSAAGLGKITKSSLINYAILDLASKKCTTWQGIEVDNICCQSRAALLSLVGLQWDFGPCLTEPRVGDL